MASAEDVILGLETPAALIDIKGALLCANPAFHQAGAPTACWRIWPRARRARPLRRMAP